MSESSSPLFANNGNTNNNGTKNKTIRSRGQENKIDFNSNNGTNRRYAYNSNLKMDTATKTIISPQPISPAGIHQRQNSKVNNTSLHSCENNNPSPMNDSTYSPKSATSSPNKRPKQTSNPSYFKKIGISTILYTIYITLTLYVISFIYLQNSIMGNANSTGTKDEAKIDSEVLIESMSKQSENDVIPVKTTEKIEEKLKLAESSKFAINKYLPRDSLFKFNKEPKSDRSSPRPRIFYYDTFEKSSYNENYTPDPMCKVTPGEEVPPQPDPPRHPRDDNCIPMASWQTDSKPNCNTMHEIDMSSSSAHNEFSNSQSFYNFPDESNTVLLGKGWFRFAWRIDTFRLNHEEGDKYNVERIVLKNLRYPDREFLDEYLDLHRRDAMALERLTASPYTMDVYSYCAQSTINELALDSVERVARKMRDDESRNLYKLYMATSVALAVADVHEIDYENNATLVHYDINPRNVAVVNGGEIKLNDFNVAEFIYWDPNKHQRCGFKGRLHEPWWRAPEEMDFEKVTLLTEEEKEEGFTPNEIFSHVKNYDKPNEIYLDEKVDIYSLGNILYRVITGRAPRGKSIAERVDYVRDIVARGEPPPLPVMYFDEKDAVYTALRHAMRRCYQKSPSKRWNARDIAGELLNTLNDLIEEKMKFIEKKKKKRSNPMSIIKFDNKDGKISLKDEVKKKRKSSSTEFGRDV